MYKMRRTEVQSGDIGVALECVEKRFEIPLAEGSLCFSLTDPTCRHEMEADGVKTLRRVAYELRCS